MSAYDSDKDVFFVRTWRTAGESITKKMKTDSPTANSIHNDMITIQAFGTPGETLAHISTPKNYTDGQVANVSLFTSVEELVDTKWDGSWKFAVVRNPYSIVYSEWKSLNKTKQRIETVYGDEKVNTLPKSGLSVERFREVVNDFNEYVKFKFDEGEDRDLPGEPGIAQKGLAGSLYHANGSIGVNEVLYYEDFNNEWNTKVAAPKGFSNNVTVVMNRTRDDEVEGPQSNVHWTQAYTNTSINLVANAYCADLELFGYSFSDGDNKPTDHTIPTSASVEPFGPWAGRSVPGRNYSSQGGREGSTSVEVYLKNRINFLTKQYIRNNS